MSQIVGILSSKNKSAFAANTLMSVDKIQGGISDQMQQTFLKFAV